WVVQAFDRWERHQAEWGKTLFYRTGELSLNQEWTSNLKASKSVLDRLGVENRVVAHDELVRHFPQVNVDGIDFGFFVPSTGVLKAREGCVAVAQAFQKKGGRILTAKAAPGHQSGGRLLEVTLAT